MGDRLDLLNSHSQLSFNPNWLEIKNSKHASKQLVNIDIMIYQPILQNILNKKEVPNPNHH